MSERGGPGELYVVATPIGNMEDFSPRARSVLAEADLILAEDTRHSRTLLSRFGISTPLTSLHAHNETQRLAGALERLRGGSRVALISDAGTPAISDPGVELVRAVRAEGIAVRSIPGPCAAVAALSIAGMPCHEFVFIGFLPARRAARRRRLQELAAETRTFVLYEGPHRLRDCLQDCAELLGARRPARLAKELTKVYETVVGDTLEDLLEWLDADPRRCRGEFVLVVGGAERAAPSRSAEEVLVLLLPHMPTAQAVKVAQRLTGQARNHIYRVAQELAGELAKHQDSHDT